MGAVIRVGFAWVVWFILFLPLYVRLLDLVLPRFAGHLPVKEAFHNAYSVEERVFLVQVCFHVAYYDRTHIECQEESEVCRN